MNGAVGNWPGPVVPVVVPAPAVEVLAWPGVGNEPVDVGVGVTGVGSTPASGRKNTYHKKNAIVSPKRANTAIIKIFFERSFIRRIEYHFLEAEEIA